MCFTEIHVRRKPELGGEQEASEHLKEGGKTHEPKSTTTTTTTTLPSRNPQCQGPQPELGGGTPAPTTCCGALSPLKIELPFNFY